MHPAGAHNVRALGHRLFPAPALRTSRPFPMRFGSWFAWPVVLSIFRECHRLRSRLDEHIPGFGDGGELLAASITEQPSNLRLSNAAYGWCFLDNLFVWRPVCFPQTKLARLCCMLIAQ